MSGWFGGVGGGHEPGGGAPSQPLPDSRQPGGKGIVTLDDAVQVVWPDFSKLALSDQTIHSDTFFMAGRFWQIVSTLSDNRMYRNFYLKYQAPGEAPCNTKTFTTKFAIEVVHPTQPELCIVKACLEPTTFTVGRDYGYANFLSLHEMHQYMHDQTSLVLRLYTGTEAVMRDEDHKKATNQKAAFVGLLNQGATCYMNSYLQSLFHLPWFRKAVYFMPSSTKSVRIDMREEESSDASSSSSSTPKPSSDSRAPSAADAEESEKQFRIAQALQRLFYNLQTATKAQSTQELTKSFGWEDQESFHQHDVQEFSRVLCDNLEAKMRSSVVEGAVSRLFRGVEESYIECLHVDYRSARKEPFYDLQLNVKGFKRLEDSLRNYLEPELLDKENKYRTDKYGLQAAKKGVRFRDFPPVLQLQLKRFEYDYMRGMMVKVNDRFEFPTEINLRPFLTLDSDLPSSSNADSPSSVESKSESASDASRVVVDMNDPNNSTYDLYAVLVHNGTLNAGHYYSYIRPIPAKPKDDKDANHYKTAPWFKFDDALAHQVTAQEAVEGNYGGPKTYDYYTGNLNTDFGSSAYMLIYVRRSLANSFEDVPTDPYVFHPVVLNDPSKFPRVGYVPKQSDLDDETDEEFDADVGGKSKEPKGGKASPKQPEKDDQQSTPQGDVGADGTSDPSEPNPYSARARRKLLTNLKSHHSQLELAMPLELVERLTDAARWRRLEAELAENKSYYTDMWLLNEPKSIVNSSVRNFHALFNPAVALPSLLYAGPSEAPSTGSTSASAVETLVAPSKLPSSVAAHIIALHAAANQVFESNLLESDVARTVTPEPDPALDSIRLETLLPSSVLGFPNERPAHLPASFVRIVNATSAGSSSSGSSNVVVAASAAACDEEEELGILGDVVNEGTKLPLLYAPSIVIAPAPCENYEVSAKRPILQSVIQLLNERGTFEALPTIEMLPSYAEVHANPKLIYACSILGATPAADLREKLAKHGKRRKSDLKGKTLLRRVQSNPILGMFPRHPARTSVTLVEERGFSKNAMEVRLGPATLPTSMTKYPNPAGYMLRDPTVMVPVFGLNAHPVTQHFMIKFYSYRLQRMVFLGSFPTNRKLSLTEWEHRLALYLYLTGLAPLRSHAARRDELNDLVATMANNPDVSQAKFAETQAQAKDYASRTEPKPEVKTQLEQLRSMAAAFPKHPLSPAIAKKWTAAPAILGVGVDVLTKASPSLDQGDVEYPEGFAAAVMGEGSVPRELNSIIGVPVRSRQVELTRHEALRFNTFARNFELVMSQLDTSWLSAETLGYLPRVEIQYEARRSIQSRESWNYIHGAMFVASEVMPVDQQRVQALRSRAQALTWRRHMVQLQFNTFQCGRLYGTLEQQRKASKQDGFMGNTTDDFVPSYVRGGATEILLNYLGEPVVRRALRRARQIYLQHLPLLESLLNSQEAAEPVPLFALRGPTDNVPHLLFDLTDHRFARHAAALRAAFVRWGLKDSPLLNELLKTFQPAIDAENHVRRSLDQKENLIKLYGAHSGAQLNANEILVRDGPNAAYRDAAEWTQAVAGVACGLDAPYYQYDQQCATSLADAMSAFNIVSAGIGSGFDGQGIAFAAPNPLSNAVLRDLYQTVGQACLKLEGVETKAGTTAGQVSSSISSYALSALLPGRAQALADELTSVRHCLSAKTFAERSEQSSRVNARMDNTTLLALARSTVWHGLRLDAEAIEDEIDTALFGPVGFEDFKSYRAPTSVSLNFLAYPAALRSLGADAPAAKGGGQVDPLSGEYSSIASMPDYEAFVEAVTALITSSEAKSDATVGGSEKPKVGALNEVALPLTPEAVAQRVRDRILRPYAVIRRHYRMELAQHIMRQVMAEAVITTALDNVIVAAPKFPLACLGNETLDSVAVRIGYAMGLDPRMVSVQGRIISQDGYQDPSTRSNTVKSLSSLDVTFSVLPVFTHVYSPLPVHIYLSDTTLTLSSAFAAYLFPSSSFAKALSPVALTVFDVENPIDSLRLACERPEDDPKEMYENALKAAAVTEVNSAVAQGIQLTEQQAMSRILAKMRSGSESRRRALLNARVEALSRMRYLPITLYVPSNSSVTSRVTMSDTVDAANAELGARFDALVIDSLEQQYFSTSISGTSPTAARRGANLNRFILNEKNDVDDDFEPFVSLMTCILDQTGLKERPVVNLQSGTFLVSETIYHAQKAQRDQVLANSGAAGRMIISEWPSNVVIPLHKYLRNVWPRVPAYVSVVSHEIFYHSATSKTIVPRPIRYEAPDWFQKTFLVLHGVFAELTQPPASPPQSGDVTEHVVGKRVRYFGGTWHGICRKGYERAESALTRIPDPLWEPESIVRDFFTMRTQVLELLTVAQQGADPDVAANLFLHAAEAWRAFMCCPARSSTVEQAVMGRAVNGIFQVESPTEEASYLCLYHPKFTAVALTETMKKLKTNQSVGASRGVTHGSAGPTRTQTGHEIRILQ